MKSCCESKSDELVELRASQGKVLKILLALNASMFFIEFTAAWWLGSTALLCRRGACAGCHGVCCQNWN